MINSYEREVSLLRSKSTLLAVVKDEDVQIFTQMKLKIDKMKYCGYLKVNHNSQSLAECTRSLHIGGGLEGWRAQGGVKNMPAQNSANVHFGVVLETKV